MSSVKKSSNLGVVCEIQPPHLLEEHSGGMPLVDSRGAFVRGTLPSLCHSPTSLSPGTPQPSTLRGCKSYGVDGEAAR